MEDVIVRTALNVKREPAKSYDLRILLSVAIVALGIFVAVYALSVAPETNLNELSTAMVYP
jgi:hypothetical protein